MTTNNHRSSAAYNVFFFTDVIYTTVTDDPAAVSQWIHDISSLYGHRLIVGLDLEWAPNFIRHQQPNPAATLQLCVGRCCLIYQLIHSPYFPCRLIEFLSYSNHTFVGIEVKSDLEKLQRDYRIGHNAKAVDLRNLAADVYRRKDFKKAGLKSLARVVLGKDLEKPKSVTMSGWDNRWLSQEQVQYACIDAFVSFEIGRILNAYAFRLDRLIVGLDVEWRPNFNHKCDHPIATLQLCVAKSCLIFQIVHAPSIPRRLREFLGDPDYTFVGVGIKNDIKKLLDDYGLEVSNTRDLRSWAAKELDKKELRGVGLKELVKEVMGEEVEKPRSVTLSPWDDRLLTGDQVAYACLDAYFSFEIARRLSAWY
ncbi:hypothetical protein BUALT_Bualt12G0039300 [Buddleja alternifolia]|uniref:3'-5' exonuclease domain-containing protein n=1 Tax=Buddleja alternifolia TaxID=168488 RepID=A0AAV6WUR4_9LAMI|nr:hypothetical protein BUALT_Bualt12G0039300 [Buddleja alternifolia]